MRYFNSPRYLLFLLLISPSMWCYLALIGAAGDSRAADHNLTSEEMYWWEIVGLYIAVGSLFYIVACSVVHCFKNLSKFVALIVLFIWPTAYIYALYHLYQITAGSKRG